MVADGLLVVGEICVVGVCFVVWCKLVCGLVGFVICVWMC